MTPLLTLLIALHAQAVALPRDVPYLPQTEALCGGAAAAMVMRYWGASDARPELFAPLIDPAQDGIVTTVLVGNLRARGWQAFPLRGSRDGAGPLRQHLARGRPLIALIEDRPSRYHYVVITAVDDTRVHFHDPAKAPSQTMAWAEFERRWSAANFWMLLLLPGGAGGEAEAASPEPALAARIAGLLRSGNTAEALRDATDAARRAPGDPIAWDALATTLFVMDRELEALDAWNRAGKPAVDTVQIAGLKDTRYRAAERLIDLQPDEQLTASTLSRARKRLSFLPSSSTSRVSYVPLADGRAQIDAAIVERSRLPGMSDLLIAAAKAPFSREIELSMTNIVGGGERVSGSWRFREGFERVAAAVDTPALLPFGALWRVEGFDARETYSVGGTIIETRRRRAAFHASDWVTRSLGWMTSAGVERWPADGNAGGEKIYAAARVMLAPVEGVDAHITAEGWMRGAGATRLSARARASRAAAGGILEATAGTEGVHGRTPLFLFPGAGDGHLRAPLLRAHPLVTSGAINVDEGQILARRLLHGTVEWARPMARVALASIDAAVFVDAARGWQMLDSRASAHQIDAGLGVRVRLPGAGTFRLDIARGLLDGRWAITGGK